MNDFDFAKLDAELDSNARRINRYAVAGAWLIGITYVAASFFLIAFGVALLKWAF